MHNLPLLIKINDNKTYLSELAELGMSTEYFPDMSYCKLVN